MNIRWFGDPWPSREKRQPVCSDDDLQVPVSSVLDQRCVECGKGFSEKDHGVITQCVGNVWYHFWMDVDNENQCVCVYHLRCWLKEVVGGVMSEKVRSRMTGEGFAHITEEPQLHPIPLANLHTGPYQPTGGTEDAEIGKGWNRSGV